MNGHDPEFLAVLLLSLGSFFLVGLVTDVISRRLGLPRVTLLLAFGFVAGPSVLDLLPDISQAWFPAVADMTLVMIGFLLGGTLERANLAAVARPVLVYSLVIAAVTAIVTGAGLAALGLPPELALVLAGIAPATDPVATAAVVREAGRNGRFARTLLGIVALDDAWGLVLFSVLLAVALAVAGDGGSGVLAHALRDLGGSIALGLALGVPMAYLTGRIQPGEPTQVEAVGMVLLCGGIALKLSVSFLLAAMVMGATVANLASHHRRPFHAIEGIEWPFMVLFFVLAGAALDVGAVPLVGIAGAGFAALRILGRLAGGAIAGMLLGGGGREGLRIGCAMMPMAGVALGMGLVATDRFPGHADIILPVVIAATVLFELAGPVATRRVLVDAA